MVIRPALLLLFSSLTLSNVAQSDPSNAFQIEKPEGWFDETDVDLRKNLEKYELSNKEVEDLMRTHNGSIPVAIFMKYDRREHAGIIPTIQVNLRPYPYSSNEQFEGAMKGSMAQMAGMLDNFKVVEELHEVEIDGRKGLSFVSNFDMPYGGGVVETVRSWTYAIPVGAYFYQINYSDLKDDDCSELYVTVTRSLRF